MAPRGLPSLLLSSHSIPCILWLPVGSRAPLCLAAASRSVKLRLMASGCFPQPPPVKSHGISLPPTASRQLTWLPLVSRGVPRPSVGCRGFSWHPVAPNRFLEMKAAAFAEILRLLCVRLGRRGFHTNCKRGPLGTPFGTFWIPPFSDPLFGGNRF